MSREDDEKEADFQQWLEFFKIVLGGASGGWAALHSDTEELLRQRVAPMVRQAAAVADVAVKCVRERRSGLP